MEEQTTSSRRIVFAEKDNKSDLAEDDKKAEHHHHHHHHTNTATSQGRTLSALTHLDGKTPIFPDDPVEIIKAPDEEETCESGESGLYVGTKDRTDHDLIEKQGLNAMEHLAPFKLKWVYGRSPNVDVVNLTGLYRNHIAYTSSNSVIIYNYVGNEQHCLQGHKNAITALSMDDKCRFLASVDSGSKSLIIVWCILSGKALKFFPNPHEGKGCSTVTFTKDDFILATIGDEEPGKQTICLWNYDPHAQTKTPIVVGNLPHVPDVLRELTFCQINPNFFAATGDKFVIFCTWLKPDNDDEKDKGSIFCYKPKTRKGKMSKYKKFSQSLWMKEGKWLATGTMSGLLCIWAPPPVLGLEDPPDPKKNIRELSRVYRLSEDGLTYFTIYKGYIIVGDEKGIIRFYDQDMKLLRWTKNFYVKPITCIRFNLTDELPSFKQHLRKTFDRQKKNYLQKEGDSRVRDYSLGGTRDKDLSMTTISRPPMPCADFIFSVAGGDVHYYHFNQTKVDLLVHGSPGRFVTCDVCPGSDTVMFSTRKGEVQVFDFVSHNLIFADQIFAGHHRVCTMKFHPTGYFVAFGLMDGHLTFRRSYSWKTLIPPLNVTNSHVLRIIFSEDGLFLSYYTSNRSVVLLRYLPKVKHWVNFGSCRGHRLDICDIQFFYDSQTQKNRLFSIGLDRYLVEYDLANCNAGDPKGLRVLKVMRLEETCQPTAMVFNGPPEFGVDCITFSNTLNKLRLFDYKEERVRATVSGPVFGRDHSINRMIPYPAKIESRYKKFIIFVRGNKLGIIDTPLDGNPHKYMAVFTHPGPIMDISVVADKQQIFTVGHRDDCALQWEANTRSVEATAMVGGSGVMPFYNVIRRNWGDACQDIVKEIELIFFYLNLKRVDTSIDIFNITQTIRISEIPAVCRACGFFPSEYEVDLMIDEARRIKIKNQHYTDDLTTEFSFDEFIKLFSNHYYKITEQEVEDAFKYLGFEEKQDINVCQSNMIDMLTQEGEKLKPCDLPVYFEALFMDENFSILSSVNLECKMEHKHHGSHGEDAEFDAEGTTGMDADEEAADGESGSSSSSSTRTADLDEDSLERFGSNESTEMGLDDDEMDDDVDESEEGSNFI